MIGTFFALALDQKSAILAEWVKIVGAFVVFWIGLTRYRRGLDQYRDAQTWKRSEFLANQIRDFEGDQRIHATLLMLDWSRRHIPLVSNRTGEIRYPVVGEATLLRALLPSTPSGGFSGVEASIRDAFDRFFDALGRLENFIELGLVDEKQVRQYIGYWLESIATDRPQHGAKLPVLIQLYLHTWDFGLTLKLLHRFGYFEKHDEALERSIVAEVSSLPAATPKELYPPDPKEGQASVG